ncbi:MAG: septum formation initiator family protein [Gemmatimonadetes bacterium]|nr:septum formation initiator family protein [Gemmatimonadota bacterium]
MKVLKRLILPGLLLLAVYYAVFGGEYSLLDMAWLHRLRVREEAARDSVRRQVDSLRSRSDSLAGDSAALERIARERYGMIRDGEVLYRFAEPPESTGVDSAHRRPPL